MIVEERKRIWHKTSEEPQENVCMLILIDNYDGTYSPILSMWLKNNYSCWNDYVRFYSVAKWCYISDIENL